MYFKVPTCVLTLFPNKSACIYDNKHASKQIPWIDEFQNERIFNYLKLTSCHFDAGGLVTLVIKRSLD